jgi:hypothetical protein
MISRTIWVAAALVMAAVTTTGCASSGNDVLRSQDANAVDLNIIDGKTTRNEVERLYGPPNATSFANAQNDIWIYRWTRSTAKAENFIPYVGAFVGGRDIQQKELVPWSQAFATPVVRDGEAIRGISTLPARTKRSSPICAS